MSSDWKILTLQVMCGDLVRKRSTTYSVFSAHLEPTLIRLETCKHSGIKEYPGKSTFHVLDDG
jgi:hypothetical protein